MYLLTEWQSWKYLARGYDLRTESSENRFFEFVTKSQIFSHSARPNSVDKNVIKWPRRTHVRAEQSLKKRS